jgi:Domain of unknown function (DUF4878)
MIKTLKFTAIALLAVALLWACAGTGSPRVVAKKFLHAFVEGDFVGAGQYATKESKESLKLMASIHDQDKGEPAKIEIGDVKEDGDKATVSYKENGVKKNLRLVKEDGKWKVDWTKDTGALEGAIDGALEGIQDGEGAAPAEKNGGEADH